jgi:histidinol phosphatase-like PHP family hydrolase
MSEIELSGLYEGGWQPIGPDFMERRTFLKSACIAGGLGATLPISRVFGAPAGNEFPLMDLHVHLTGNFTIDTVMEISRKTNVQFGIVVNPGGAVNDDAGLKRFIELLRPYSVYCGLQPMSPGWSRSFSSETIKQLDYVLMDAQTIPSGNGYAETLRIWNFDTYVDDPQKFMDTYMTHILEVINNNEPLDIFGWPLFLPVCIARDYYALWTDERMQKIVAALKRKDLAVEINDLAHTPHERFINMAKEHGLKFTFGSDTRDQKAGRLDFCKNVAKKCNLKRDDFFIPKRVLNRA